MLSELSLKVYKEDISDDDTILDLLPESENMVSAHDYCDKLDNFNI